MWTQYLTPKQQSWLYVCLPNVAKLIRESLVFAKAYEAFGYCFWAKAVMNSIYFSVFSVSHIYSMYHNYDHNIFAELCSLFLLLFYCSCQQDTAAYIKIVVSDSCFILIIWKLYIIYTRYIKITVKQCYQKIVYINISYIQ